MGRLLQRLFHPDNNKQKNTLKKWPVDWFQHDGSFVTKALSVLGWLVGFCGKRTNNGELTFRLSSHRSERPSFFACPGSASHRYLDQWRIKLPSGPLHNALTLRHTLTLNGVVRGRTYTSTNFSFCRTEHGDPCDVVRAALRPWRRNHED